MQVDLQKKAGTWWYYRKV